MEHGLPDSDAQTLQRPRVPRRSCGEGHDGRNYVDVDVSIVVDHITLAAADLGLATCWIGAFNVPAAREILGLPDEVEPIAFTPLGYSDTEPRPKTRKELNELVRYDNW